MLRETIFALCVGISIAPPSRNADQDFHHHQGNASYYLHNNSTTVDVATPTRDDDTRSKPKQHPVKSGESPIAIPSNNCWPQGQYTLFQAAEGCPTDSWNKGHTVNYMNKRSKVPTDIISGSVAGRYLRLDYCTHGMKNAEPGCSVESSPTEFPPGSYCIFQHGESRTSIVTASCPFGFKWSWIALDDISGGNVSHTGYLPAGEYFSFATVQYFCCRDDGYSDTEIVLPNKKPFVLFPTSVNKTCQKVAGMTGKKSEVFYDTADDSVWRNGAPTPPEYTPPEYYVDTPKGFWGKGLHLKICRYTLVSTNTSTNTTGSVGGESDAVALLAITSTDLETPACWPTNNFVLYQSKMGCPAEFTSGSVHHTLGPNSRPAPSLNTSLDNTGLKVDFCARTFSNITSKQCSPSKTATWDRGSYCFFQGDIKKGGIIDRSCPPHFEFSWFMIDDVNQDNVNKVVNLDSVPYGEYYDYGTVYYFCCRDDGLIEEPIKLPTDHPFVLLPTEKERKCQEVVGMKSSYETLFYDTEHYSSGFIPASPRAIFIDYVFDAPKGFWGAGASIRVCHYTRI